MFKMHRKFNLMLHFRLLMCKLHKLKKRLIRYNNPLSLLKLPLIVNKIVEADAAKLIV